MTGNQRAATSDPDERGGRGAVEELADDGQLKIPGDDGPGYCAGRKREKIDLGLVDTMLDGVKWLLN
jgi:hypothetical protein